MYVLVVPTASVVLRAALLLAALYGFGTLGIAGLRDSLQGQRPAVLSMEQVARSGFGGARFVRLSGRTDGRYLYVRSRGASAGGAFIEYALLPPGAQAAAQVVVSDHFIDSSCALSGEGCLRPGGRTVQGVLRTGPGAIPLEVEDFLRGEGLTLSPGAALLVAGSTPAPVWISVLVMLGLGIVIFVVGASFVPGVRLW